VADIARFIKRKEIALIGNEMTITRETEAVYTKYISVARPYTMSLNGCTLLDYSHPTYIVE
jgi:hypothetical protein